METLKPRTGPKTLADWLSLPEPHYFELIDGELIEKASPDIVHGIAQGALMAAIRGPFARRAGGPGSPGGWWIASEVDVLLEGRVFRPDVAGWRRERVPMLSTEHPYQVRPDWVCEIISDSNRRHDTLLKKQRYHEAEIPHYWLLDPTLRALSVYRNTPEGYLSILDALADERVRAEPFDAIELHVGFLLGDDVDD